MLPKIGDIVFSVVAVIAASTVGLVNAATSGTNYNVGIGIADVTGPAAEIGMMGYAKAGQNTHGIHLRLFSRAFIFEEPETGKRNVFVSVDAGMMGALIKMKVIEKLKEAYGDSSLYTHANVVLSGTHTHSGPAGFLQYVIFDVSSAGFVDQTFQAMVNGITKSIQRAHDNMKLSTLSYAEGEIDDANINRSPTSYLANPVEERAQFNGNTDHTMVQLNIFAADDGRPRGVINWFAVHPTSMNNTNKLISGDNKGKASQLLEKEINGKGVLTGKGEFVAAFASTNLGDVSPNLKGPHCVDTGLPCDLVHSTCNGRTEKCWAAGPGKDMFESTKIIAERQFEMSKKLLMKSDDQTPVNGPVKFIHQWIDMTNQQVKLSDGTTVKTCKPALGYSFAAGTTDGPGAFDFTQGKNTSNPFWDFVVGIIKDPSPEQEACHFPKPILLDTGEMSFPYDWHPKMIDTQMLQIGQFVISAVPGEFTTMSGRRLRKTVKDALTEASVEVVRTGRQFDTAFRWKREETTAELPEYKVVVAGLSNVYTHYITTFEEYQRQRYEAASTIFGPHSLQAYQQQYAMLANKLVKSEGLAEGTPPANLYSKQISFVPGVLYDNPPLGKHFGDCLVQPPTHAVPGDVVSVQFVSGHLRNDLMQESSFLYVEKLMNTTGGEWKVVATDADWDTKLHWKRTNVILGESIVIIEWEIPEDVELGTYRIRHQGVSKNIIKKTFYSGTTQHFSVSLQPASNQNSQNVADKADLLGNPLAAAGSVVSSIKDRVTQYVNSQLQQFYSVFKIAA